MCSSTANNALPEYRFIASLVDSQHSVLHVGCGNGDLLRMLQVEREALVQGIEPSESSVQECVARGLTVYHGDLAEGLADFPDQSVDYVIATRLLQTTQHPAELIEAMVRVGRVVIVSLPNYAYWRTRFGLLMRGGIQQPPLPCDCSVFPQVSFTTIKAFRTFCRGMGIRIEKESGIITRTNGTACTVRTIRNLLANLAVFLLERE